MTDNTLYYGDNLKVLREHVADESVDLVYLDPPFNSNAGYNVLFAEHDHTESAAQIRAFEDTWRWDAAAAEAFHDAVQSGHGRVPDAMQGFHAMLGDSDMLAYLSMMAPRLIELHRVLKSTGSIYLHCDPTASHYLKMLLDAVFGPQNFLNEIVWKRTTAHSDKKQGATHFGRIHDIILRYARDIAEVEVYDIIVAHDPAYIESHYRNVDENGRRFQWDNLTGPGGASKGNPYYEVLGVSGYWRYSRQRMANLIAEGLVAIPPKGKKPRLKRYLDEHHGMPLGSVWTDLPPINSQAKERLGYPTQKPERLLERIVKASSNEGDVVLDPFCGCGTAVAVAQKLKRRWIGIDVTHLAVNLIKHRLKDGFGVEAGKDYSVVGEPEALADSRQLAEEDPFQFQAWALGLVGARISTSSKKGADKGIDGRMFFHDEADTKSAATKHVVLSVKGGKTGVSHLRDLRGVIDREEAAIGVLITMQEPTKPMKVEAASAGFYTSPGWKSDHLRLQILTVEELLGGQSIDMPPTGDMRTFKKAPKTKRTMPRGRQRELHEEARPVQAEDEEESQD